jgi:hypothetical protein
MSPGAVTELALLVAPTTTVPCEPGGALGGGVVADNVCVGAGVHPATNNRLEINRMAFDRLDNRDIGTGLQT